MSSLTGPEKTSAFIPLPILEGNPAPPPVNLQAIREKLATARGPEYWRSLEELAATEEFQDYLTHEFPKDAELWKEPISRRTFLKLMGASFAMAFFTGCRKPLELIIPYTKQPEDVVPGKPLYFASALPVGGYARGVLVENHLGRPTKIEGNPEHPDSLGASDIFMQASVLTFYDPDRSQVITREGLISTWDEFLKVLQSEMSAFRKKGGDGLRILTETVTSPSLGDQLTGLMKEFPKAQWHVYEPVSQEGAREGARMAFGHVVEPLYHIDRADVILAVDADFLTGWPGSLHYARDFSRRRQVNDENPRVSRLYAVESTPTVTGSCADHRLPLCPADIERMAWRLAQSLGVSGAAADAPPETNLNVKWAAWLEAAARDLERHRGAGLVLAGASQPPAVHALVHAINHALGNAGRTVTYIDSVEIRPPGKGDSLRDLGRDMKAGSVDTLLILAGNPAYCAPADLQFAQALSHVKTRIHLGLYEDETSALCQWHIPEAHPLEAWGDLRAYDGTVSLLQPQIAPLYGGKTSGEILSAALDASPRSAHAVVHDFWKKRSHALDFESTWKKSLHDGVVAGTAYEAKSPALRTGFAKDLLTPSKDDGNLAIVFRPDPAVWDGRYANNGWLQELPKPFTKLTWDNAALIGPDLADRLGVSSGDLVELRLKDRSVEAPVFILPGQAARTVTVTLGYGRTRAGQVGNGAGFNAYALRTSEAPWSTAGLSVRRTGGRRNLASTQHHFSMEGRDFVRSAALAEYERNPQFAKRPEKTPTPQESLFNYSKPAKSEDYAWGMGIDLNLCTGCNACIVACQAENNIPVVGKDQVSRGREMHWLRVDGYFSGDLDHPELAHQPVPCMQCEDAPCEVVCPVGATSHSEEGLNQMIYNRCIGTRYCSNNCPYKVRHFNFLHYTENITGPLKLLMNPDVTVRSRGVMEKCTYCVQRIQAAKIAADKDGRLVQDGEITPACAQACPSGSIVFGNLLDKKSRVARKKADPRDYGILTDLGTRPRTTYQARLKNPNPEIPEA